MEDTTTTPDDAQLMPEQAFLTAIDNAMAATFDCLVAAGAEEENIWNGLQSALAKLHRAAMDVENVDFPVLRIGPAAPPWRQTSGIASHPALRAESA